MIQFFDCLLGVYVQIKILDLSSIDLWFMNPHLVDRVSLEQQLFVLLGIANDFQQCLDLPNCFDYRNEINFLFGFEVALFDNLISPIFTASEPAEYWEVLPAFK